ncbi:hypothetical protein N802_06485 [Knoellia sinensis KCTC 19936]|uniref:DUF4031 domain-containing protein n=1 Tax=Knoellia sinensis KCTC 19936 TaxID=1385520 RepID=A0A0A0J0P0_9MICO|nr:DUF4031 domain-containing protein [Knoellia sinensis]KGN30638.1 hypothetical protein N802_06485 [Knoellia sinensis KCTC 19936]
MLLIDPPAWPAYGRLWSHLVSDTSIEELHDFAARAGIPRRGFEGDHYDVPEERYAAVVAAGAEPIAGRELLKRLRDSGLRIPKRKHERVVVSTREPAWLPSGSRADVIASRQDSAPPMTVLVRVAVHGVDGLLVVPRPDGDGVDLPSRTLAAGEAPEDAVDALLNELGMPSAPHSVLGYVRNVVRQPDAHYPWPVPFACFTVYAVRAPESAPVTGEWCPAPEQQERLAMRHWWPLMSHLGDSGSAAGLHH